MKVPVKNDSQSKVSSSSVGKALRKLEQLTELNTAKRKAKQFRRDFQIALRDLEKTFEKKDPPTTKTCMGILFDTAGELFSCEAEVRDAWCALDDFDEKEYQKYQDEVYEYRRKWIEMWSYVTADIYLDPEVAEQNEFIEQNSTTGQRNPFQTNKSFQKFKFINDSARVLTFPRATDNEEFTEQTIAALVAAQEKYITQKLEKEQAKLKAKKQKRKEKLAKQNKTEAEGEAATEDTTAKRDKTTTNELNKKEEAAVEYNEDEEQNKGEGEKEVEISDSEEEGIEPISDSEEEEDEVTDEEDTPTAARPKKKRTHEPLMLYTDLEHWDLHEGLETLEINITDTTSLAYGILSGYVEGAEHADYVFNTLTPKMTEYCNSEIGRRPYLPKSCEMCIVKPPHTQAMRAFRTCKPASASTLHAKVCFIDYGHYEDVPISHIRQIQPEFVRGVPCAALTFEIEDFPKEEISEEMLSKAIEYLQTSDGKLKLTVHGYKRDEPGYYTLEVPELVKILSGKS